MYVSCLYIYCSCACFVPNVHVTVGEWHVVGGAEFARQKKSKQLQHEVEHTVFAADVIHCVLCDSE